MKYIKNTKTMLYKSKLKGSFGRVYPISLIIIYILCMVEIFVRWIFIKNGYENIQFPYLSFVEAGLFFITMGFIQLRRYKLWIYPVIGIFAGLGCFLAIHFVPGSHFIFRIAYMVNLLIIILIVVINWPLLKNQERYEANARRLFKLASELVSETSNGFTQRPFAAGKISISKEELFGLVRFINGKFIARSIHQENLIYLIFSMNKSVLKVKDPTEVSYIEINHEGKVSVKISENDYHLYKDTFNFDQLCENMAGVFIRFTEYYKNQNENRIITELKSV